MTIVFNSRINPSVLTPFINSFKKEKEVAQKKLVEHNALLQAVEMGMTKKDIMEKFNIKGLQELKLAYFDALVALDKIKDVKKGRKPKKVDNKVSINSRGSLVIPKKLIDDLDLDEMDTFRVVKSNSGLMLQTVKKPPKTILRKRNGHTLVKNSSEASGLPN